MSLGPYASFIVTSYALTAFAVAALIVWIVLDFRRQQRALRDLEAGGMTRRSAKAPDKRS